MGNIVNPANLGVADARRSDAVRRVKRQLDSLHGEIRRGTNGANGMLSDYLTERLEFLKSEAERLQQEVARLNALGGEELIREFCPAIGQMEAMANEPVPTLRDSLQRGPTLPKPVDVQYNPPPVRHEGPPVTMERHQGMYAGLEGWEPGQVHTPDNSKYRRP